MFDKDEFLQRRETWARRLQDHRKGSVLGFDNSPRSARLQSASHLPHRPTNLLDAASTIFPYTTLFRSLLTEDGPFASECNGSYFTAVQLRSSQSRYRSLPWRTGTTMNYIVSSECLTRMSFSSAARRGRVVFKIIERGRFLVLTTRLDLHAFSLPHTCRTAPPTCSTPRRQSFPTRRSSDLS